jgi:hypothetical protein
MLGVNFQSGLDQVKSKFIITIINRFLMSGKCLFSKKLSEMIYAGVLMFLLILGFVMIRRDYYILEKNYEFVQEYLNRFTVFTNRFGSSGAHGIVFSEYDWLLRRSTKVQRTIGAFGVHIYVDWLTGFKNNSYELIVNILPKFPDASVESQLIIVAHQSLTRYLGDIEDKTQELAQDLRNPLICLKVGINTMFQFPLWLLKWFGLLSEHTVVRASQSWLFKFFVFATAFAGFISSLITIADGWDKLLPFFMRVAKFIGF